MGAGRLAGVPDQLAAGARAATPQGARVGHALAGEATGAATRNMSLELALRDFARLRRIQDDVLRLAVGDALWSTVEVIHKGAVKYGLELTDVGISRICGGLIELRTSDRMLAGLSRMTTGGKLNAFNGLIREQIVVGLPAMRDLVASELANIRRSWPRISEGAVWDTSVHGRVTMPTRADLDAMRASKRAPRSYQPAAMGPDLVMGAMFERSARKGGKYYATSGVREDLHPWGLFEPASLGEIKGWANAGDGPVQISRFYERAQQRFMFMGDRALALNVRRGLIQHHVIVPAGEGVRAAEAAARRLPAELDIHVHGYPKEIDDALKAFGAETLQEFSRLEALMLKARRSGTAP